MIRVILIVVFLYFRRYWWVNVFWEWFTAFWKFCPDQIVGPDLPIKNHYFILSSSLFSRKVVYLVKIPEKNCLVHFYQICHGLKLVYSWLIIYTYGYVGIFNSLVTYPFSYLCIINLQVKNSTSSKWHRLWLTLFPRRTRRRVNSLCSWEPGAVEWNTWNRALFPGGWEDTASPACLAACQGRDWRVIV